MSVAPASLGGCCGCAGGAAGGVIGGDGGGVGRDDVAPLPSDGVGGGTADWILMLDMASFTTSPMAYNGKMIVEFRSAEISVSDCR